MSMLNAIFVVAPFVLIYVAVFLPERRKKEAVSEFEVEGNFPELRQQDSGEVSNLRRMFSRIA